MLNAYITNDYARALTILITLSLILRLAIAITQRFLIKITSKTKTNLDDELIKRTSTPLTIITFLIVLRYSIIELNLQTLTESITVNIIYTLLVIFTAQIIYIILDLIIINLLRKIAIKTKTKIDESVISLSHSVLSLALLAMSIIYILDLWGIQIAPLLAGLGIAGLAVALALQPILSNVFSGASMIFDQSVRVGDLVYLEDNKVQGKIEKIGLRSTRVRSFDNEYIIIPNTKLANSIIQNVALPEPKSRVVIPFSTAYGADIQKVKTLILKELKQILKLESNPEPFVKFDAMADSSLNFKAYFHVESFEDRFKATDEANTRIYNALNKAGIEIPFPQMDVNLKK